MFCGNGRSNHLALVAAVWAALLFQGQAAGQFRGNPQQRGLQAQRGPLLNALQRQSASLQQAGGSQGLQQGTSQSGCPSGSGSQTTTSPTSGSTTGSTSTTPAQGGLQQLQRTLQTELQQTNALLAALQQSGASNQGALISALQQLQTDLQTALQQTTALLTAQSSNGQQSPLAQQQSVLGRQQGRILRGRR